MPSDTGQPGGKRTGQRMSHYIIEDGAFAQAKTKLLAGGFTITWMDRAAEEAGKGKPGKKATRQKYTCPDCGLNAWAKPEITLVCGACEVELVAD